MDRGEPVLSIDTKKKKSQASYIEMAKFIAQKKLKFMIMIGLI